MRCAITTGREQPNFTQDPEMKMSMTKGLGMNTTAWRNNIYVLPNKPSAMSSSTQDPASIIVEVVGSHRLYRQYVVACE